MRADADAAASRCGIFILARDASIIMRARAKRYQARTRAKRTPSGYHALARQAATTRSRAKRLPPARAKVAAITRSRAPSGYHAPLTDREGANTTRYPQHYLAFLLCAQSNLQLRGCAVLQLRQCVCVQARGQRVTQPPRRRWLGAGGGITLKQTTNPSSSRTLRRSAAPGTCRG